MKQLFFLLLIAFANVGCDIQANISYKIANQSTQTIKVVFFNSDSHDSATYNKIDSVFVDVNTEKLIVVQAKGLSHVSGSKEKDTYLNEFKSFDVYQQSIKSKTDFLLSSKWSYNEKNNHNAEYTCTVYQSDF